MAYRSVANRHLWSVVQSLITMQNCAYLSQIIKSSCTSQYSYGTLEQLWKRDQPHTKFQVMSKSDNITTHPWPTHDDVIKWKHFPRNWPFVRGIHRSPVNSSHKGQWRGALMFSLMWVWINDWVNNREASDLRRYRTHYDVIVMSCALTRLSYLQEQAVDWRHRWYSYWRVACDHSDRSCLLLSLHDANRLYR